MIVIVTVLFQQTNNLQQLMASQWLQQNLLQQQQQQHQQQQHHIHAVAASNRKLHTHLNVAHVIGGVAIFCQRRECSVISSYCFSHHIVHCESARGCQRMGVEARAGIVPRFRSIDDAVRWISAGRVRRVSGSPNCTRQHSKPQTADHAIDALNGMQGFHLSTGAGDTAGLYIEFAHQSPPSTDTVCCLASMSCC